MGIVAVVCNVASKPQAQYAALIFIGVVALARHEMARGGVPRSLAASLGKAGPGEYTYDDGESGVQPMATQITVNYPAGPGPAGLGGLTVTASITDARATGLAAVAAAAHDTMQFPRTVPAVLAFDPNVHPLSGNDDLDDPKLIPPCSATVKLRMLRSRVPLPRSLYQCFHPAPPPPRRRRDTLAVTPRAGFLTAAMGPDSIAG